MEDLYTELERMQKQETELCAEHKLTHFTAEDRDNLWRTMHRLEVWPDFVPG